MREISIFISSPGDVAEERLIAARVVERLAHRFADQTALKPCFWEHLPLKATASFQPQIPKPSEFDIMIMMLWCRIGTRLSSEMQRPDGTFYDSGTEFEFEDAVAGYRKSGRPHFLVYRKTARVLVDVNFGKKHVVEVSEQKEKVDQFFDRWFRGDDNSFRGAFRDFKHTAEFEELLETHLRFLIDEILAASGEDRESKGRAAIEWDPAQQGSPFRGLRRFDFKHRAIYFGRTKAITEVLETLRRQAATGRQFVLVFGKSGVGKSSFLRAGVLPFLVEPGVIPGVGAWRRAIFEPADATGDLLNGLAAALLSEDALPELVHAVSESELAELLRKSPEAVVPLLRRELSLIADNLQKQRPLDQPMGAALALLIDPVEEIFTRPGATHEDRQRFVEVLGVLARSKLVWVLGSMRSDFYERCAELPGLLELQAGQGQYHLAPPTPVEIGRMIRLPAQLSGLRFEKDKEQGHLDEVLCTDTAGNPGALPLLQFTLDEIFKKSRAAKTGLLSFQSYRELGGLNGAVRTRAEETLATVASELGAQLDGAFNAVFSALIDFKDEGMREVVRLYSPLKRLSETPECEVLVKAFITARLFMTDIDDDKRPVVTVSHETLLRQWPRLSEWIEKNQEFLRSRKRIEAAAARWREERCDTAFLLPEGKPLTDGRELLKAHRARLDAPQIKYLEESIQHSDKLRRKQHRRLQAVVVTMTTLAVLAGIFAAISISKAREATAKTNEAEEDLDKAEYRRIIATNALNSISEARDESELHADEADRLVQVLFRDIGPRLQPSDPQNRRVIALITKSTLDHYAGRKIEDEAPATRIDQSHDMIVVASNLYRMGRYPEALQFGQRIVQLLESVGSEQAGGIAEASELVAQCQNQLARYDEAEVTFKKAVALTHQPADLQRLNDEMGELYRFVGRYAEAEHLLAIKKKSEASGPRLRAMSELLRYEGRLPEAEQLLGEAGSLAEDSLNRADAQRTELRNRRNNARTPAEIATLDSQLGDFQTKIEKATDDRFKVRSDLGVLRYEQHRFDEARTLLTEALQRDIEAKGSEHPLVAADQYKLARVLIKLGALPEAEDMLRECRQTLTIAMGADPNQRMAKCLEVLAALRAAQQRPDEAMQIAQQVLEMRTAIFHAPHPEIWKALEQIAEIHELKGDATAAAKVRAQVEAMKTDYQARESKFRNQDAPTP